MKRFLFLAVLAAVTGPALAADVGVSISVGQPGFYGRIDIGNYPPPQVVYSQPVIIQPEPDYVDAEPIYLRVPPRHHRNWRRYCSRYHACGRPVYFVREDWYEHEYVPHYREEHRDFRERNEGEHHGHGDREGRHDNGEEHDHGHRNGHNNDD